MHILQKVPTPPVNLLEPRCTGGFRILRPPVTPPLTPPVQPPVRFVICAAPPLPCRGKATGRRAPLGNGAGVGSVTKTVNEISTPQRWLWGGRTGGRREVSATDLPSSNPFLQRRFRRKREVGRLNQHFSLEVSIIIPIFAPCIPMHTLYNQNHKEQICKQ